MEDDAPGKAMTTGKYDMKMLSRLGKMEQHFRIELATVWGVEDEDFLPDSLQVGTHHLRLFLGSLMH